MNDEILKHLLVFRSPDHRITGSPDLVTLLSDIHSAVFGLLAAGLE